jgi:hypothetical protein
MDLILYVVTKIK